MKKALEDIRILDLSRVLAGPFCTQILGDMGAEIIKVERPGAGDDTRQWGPPFLKDKDGNETSESAYYLCINRNKKSVAIDMATEEGQFLLHKLIEQSDVLIHNFKVGSLEKYGLEYDQIKDRYPTLIYTAISGFGQTGPMAKDPGYDFLAQGMAGIMTATGAPDGPPMKAGISASDLFTGLHAAIGTLAALHARMTTGRGQLVDVGLTDCTLAVTTNLAQFYLSSGECAPRVGNAHSVIVPYGTYEASDGYVIVAVANDPQFVRLCGALGHPEWAADERFIDNKSRVANRKVIVPMIAEVIKTKTIDEWIKILKALSIPCGPVNTMDRVFKEEQILARDMKIQMEHPWSPEPIDLVGSPFKFSDTPVSYELPPPYCGQHTQEVLEKILNLGPDEISQLQEKKAIDIT